MQSQLNYAIEQEKFVWLQKSINEGMEVDQK
jgi:hypothetical protein